MHHELYCIMGEHDGAGYPLTYCLLNSASSIEIGKRTNALRLWAEAVKARYDVHPTFIHLDKDMAEISMARQVWDAKIQLCWWHLRRAVRQRMANRKLTTTPYNSQRAHQEFAFISPAFSPMSAADSSEYEGGILPDQSNNTSTSQDVSPNAISLRIAVPPTIVHRVPSPEPIRLTIRIPATSQATDSHSPEPEPKRVFCEEEYRDHIVTLIERHFCAHPLIPGYSHPSPRGIREWAVKQMYQFCLERDLREVWAYLWENWYRSGRWELWARSAYPDIPRLKTTMMLESQ